MDFNLARPPLNNTDNPVIRTDKPKITRALIEIAELIKPDNRKLLGICFWREGVEAAFGPEQRGERGVVRGPYAGT